MQYPLLLLRVHLLYSTLLAATPSPPLSDQPLPSFLADLATRYPSCRPLYVHVHPLITSYPAHLPGPQSSNYIHSALRLSGSRGSNSVHLSLRTDCDSSDRTSCVFLFPPLSRPPPSVSSHLCLARQAPVSVFGDRTVVLRLSLTPDIRSSSSVHVRPATTTGWKRYLGISACVLSANRVILAKGEGLSSSITVPQVWLNRSTIIVASYVTSVLRGRIFSYFSFFSICSTASPFNDTAQEVVKIYGR